MRSRAFGSTELALGAAHGNVDDGGDSAHELVPFSEAAPRTPRDAEHDDAQDNNKDDEEGEFDDGLRREKAQAAANGAGESNPRVLSGEGMPLVEGGEPEVLQRLRGWVWEVENKLVDEDSPVPFSQQELTAVHVIDGVKTEIVGVALLCGGTLPTLRRLLDSGARIRFLSDGLFTAAHMVIMRGNGFLGDEATRLEIVKEVVKRGVDINHRIGVAFGMNSVALSVLNGFPKITEYLLSLPPTTPPCTLVLGDQEALDLVVADPGYDWSKFPRWNQMIKRHDGQPSSLNDLPDVYTPMASIMHSACFLGQIDVMRLLLKHPRTHHLARTVILGAVPFDMALSSKGNDSMLSFLCEQKLPGSSFAELLEKHPNLTVPSSTGLVRVPPNVRFCTMCTNSPRGAVAALNRTAWLYYKRSGHSFYVVDVRILVSEADALRQCASALTPEYLSAVDPINTLWGTFTLVMQWNDNTTMFRECAPVQKITQLKWDTFGLAASKREAMTDLLVAVLVSVLSFLHPGRHRAACIALTVPLLLLAAVRLRTEVKDMTLPKGHMLYFASVWNYFDLASGVLVTLLCVARLGAMGTARELAALALVVCWIKMLQYLSLVPGLVGFVKMIGRMINDMFKFVWLCSVFVVAYTLAFHVLLRDKGVDGFSTVYRSLLSCYSIMLGELMLEEIGEAGGVFAELLWVSYTAIVSLLLLNMLIAMMSATFERVAEDTIGEVLCTRASYLIRLERLLSPKERQRHWEAIFSQRIPNGNWMMDVDADNLVH